MILNIIDQPNNLIPASAIVFSSPRDKLDEINNTLQRLSKALHIMRSGKPADEIVAVSEERDIDLIVMASSRIASAITILGSTAKEVLNIIRKPVVIIHE